jgi:hypothetical protein
MEDVGQPNTGASAVPADNADVDNDADNDQDLSVDPEPPIEQQVWLLNYFV